MIQKQATLQIITYNDKQSTVIYLLFFRSENWTMRVTEDMLKDVTANVQAASKTIANVMKPKLVAPKIVDA